MPWLTPETLSVVDRFSVHIPDDETCRAAFLGAYLELTRPENWEPFGSVDPEQIADLFAECYFAMLDLNYCTKEKPP